jgi:hypothetical protein
MTDCLGQLFDHPGYRQHAKIRTRIVGFFYCDFRMTRRRTFVGLSHLYWSNFIINPTRTLTFFPIFIWNTPRVRSILAMENSSEELLDSQFPNLRIFVTSRPDMDIKAVLDPLNFRSISLHEESEQLEYIDNYIKSVVDMDRMMRRWKASEKQLVIDRLTQKADGI